MGVGGLRVGWGSGIESGMGVGKGRVGRKGGKGWEEGWEGVERKGWEWVCESNRYDRMYGKPIMR